ncbi:hypothetical protein [Streptomyces sp. NPDC097610]|uniref:hypothetical protein n=1 Tax=Streptomyces sp. NPDC097610 TaxID=3157227 RepID=UPI00331FCD4C
MRSSKTWSRSTGAGSGANLPSAVNAALLNHDLTLADLYVRYTSPQATELTTAELIEWDRAYYAAHRRSDPAVAGPAGRHAVSMRRKMG